jgi:hypothetical protein
MRPLDREDPRTLGAYRILARLGVGGTATVYLGRSRGGRAVAVKVMHAELAREAAFRARFRREVAITGAAGGVHGPPLLDADPDAPAPWMATAFLPSVALRAAVEEFGPLPAGSVRRLAAGLAEALAALHRSGILHLDVTPANVLLTVHGPRLIDFGIAAGARTGGPPGVPRTGPATPWAHEHVDAPPEEPAGTTSTEPVDPADEPGGAAPGVPAGSSGFMSPEQMAGRAGPPSDVYSLAATLEYARGGQGRGDTVLSALIADCRRPDPAARPTAAELTDRLATAVRDEEPPGTGWLPARVLAAIDRQAGAADNPPLPPAAPQGRRLLLVGGTAALATAAAAGLAAVLAATLDGPKPEGRRALGPQPAPSRARPSATAPSASATPTPTAKPAALKFLITGGGPLTELDYAVNGRFTRLKTTRLPWQKTVEVPGDGGSVDWQLRLTVAAGKVRCRVFLNGHQVRDEHYPSATMPFFNYPNDVVTGGSEAVSGPLPGAGS